MKGGQNFPISEYYRANIIDAETISRGGGWWTAVLIIRDPQSQKPFLAIYRWQHDGETWKMRKSISFKNNQQIEDVIGAINRLKAALTE